MSKTDPTTTRRRLLTTVGSAAAVIAVPVTSRAAAADPIFEMIAMHKKLQEEWSASYCQLDAAQAAAAKEHGRRPSELIHWRGWDIGDYGIEERRETLLIVDELDPATVEEEYLD